MVFKIRRVYGVSLSCSCYNICMKRSNLFSAGKYEGRDHRQDFCEILSVYNTAIM